jgi:hypothetical protein
MSQVISQPTREKPEEALLQETEVGNRSRSHCSLAFGVLVRTLRRSILTGWFSNAID